MIQLLEEKERQTIASIKNHIACKGYWRMSNAEKEVVLQSLLMELNTIWDKHVFLYCDFENTQMYLATGGGTFSAQYEAITLYKGSLMTLLHEFAHSIFRGIEEGGEEVARRWSHRMFKGSMPRTYLNAVENNSFLHTFTE